MKKFAIILAGGEGHRAGGDVPKQFRDLCGRPLVWWAMKAFAEASADTEIVLVVHPGFIDDWQLMWESLPEGDRIPFILSCGGRSRPESVSHGLMSAADRLAETGASGEEAVVMVHDGARPLVSCEMIRRGLESLRPGEGVIPAVGSVNSLRRISDPGIPLDQADSESVDRSLFVEVQTPQIFHLSTLASAYRRDEDLSRFTDDASVAEACGVRIKLFEGETTNIKVTHPLDFEIADVILRKLAPRRGWSIPAPGRQ